MKGWAKVVLVLALAALLGVSLVACGGESGPEDAVKGALKAFGAMDAEKTASYFPEEEREELISGLEIAFAFVDDMKVLNIKTGLVSQTEDTATVDAEWDMEGTLFGQKETEHVDDTMRLEKVDGTWLIVEAGLLEQYGY